MRCARFSNVRLFETSRQSVDDSVFRNHGPLPVSSRTLVLPVASPAPAPAAAVAPPLLPLLPAVLPAPVTVAPPSTATWEGPGEGLFEPEVFTPRNCLQIGNTAAAF